MTDYFEDYDEQYSRDYSGTTRAALPSHAANNLDQFFSRLKWNKPKPVPDYTALHARDAVRYSPFATPAVGGAPKQAFAPAGPPQRFNLNLLGDAINSAPGQAFLGTPGEQRGGSIHGFATAPVNFQNFATYAREAPLSVITSLMGHNYQQSTTPYAQPVGPQNTDNIFENLAQLDLPNVLDNFIDGVAGPGGLGDMINAPFVALTKAHREADAINRGKGIRDLVAHGWAIGSPIARITSTFDQSRFDWASITRKAEAAGISTTDMAAELWDLDPAIVREIQANPGMSDEQLEKLVRDEPFSYDPNVDFLANLGSTVIPMVAVGALTGGTGFVARGASLLPRLAYQGVTRGAHALEGAAGLQKGAMATKSWANLERLGLLGRSTQTAEWAGSWSLMKAWRPIKVAATGLERANRYSLMAGTGIRFGEWGLKQVAVTAGNQDAVEMMDAWLWEMPLSNNPGLMMVDAFAVHPIRTVKNEFHRGPGSATARVFGTIHGIDLSPKVARHLGNVRDMPLETLQERIFDRLGFDAGMMEKATGADSPFSLMDFKEALYHVALEAVRDRHPESAHLIPAGRLTERSDGFVRQYGDEAAELLNRALDGRGPDADVIVNMIREEFWTRRNIVDASELGSIGYIGPYDGAVAFDSLTSWMRASKAFQQVADDVVPALREDLPATPVAAFRAEFASKYKSGQMVSARDLNRLRNVFPGSLNLGGGMLRPVEGVKPKITWGRLEKLLDLAERDQAVRDFELAQPARDVIPGLAPSDAVNEKAIAQAFKLRQDTVRALLGGEPAGPIPPDLAKILHDVYNTSSRDLTANPELAWQRALTWWERVYAGAVERGAAMADVTQVSKVMADRLPADKTGVLSEAMNRIRSVINHPYADVDKSNPAVGVAVAARNKDVSAFVDRVNGWLNNPARNHRTFAQGDARYLEVPGAFGTRQALLIASLREQAIAFAEGADAALLADPLAHPLELVDPILAAIDNGMEVNPLQRQMLADTGRLDSLAPALEEILGPDVVPDRATVEAAGNKVLVHEAELVNIGTEAKGLAGLIDRSPKQNLSGEMIDFLERAKALGGRTVGAGKQFIPAWRGLPLTQRGVATASRQVENARVRARLVDDVTRAERALEEANAVAERASAKVGPIRVQDIEWEPEAVSRHATRKAAVAEAKLLRDQGFGTRVEKVSASRWGLFRGTLKATDEVSAVPDVPVVPDVPLPAIRPAEGFGPDVDVVPTDILRRYMEIDRATTEKGGGLSTDLESLVADIKANGVREAVVIEFDPLTQTAILSDGNHRLTAADLGDLKELPTRVEIAKRTQLETDAGGPIPGFVPVDIPWTGEGVPRPSDLFRAAEPEAPVPAPDAPGPAAAPEVAAAPGPLTREQREASFKQSPDYTGTFKGDDGRGIMYGGTMADADVGYPKLRSDLEFYTDKQLAARLKESGGNVEVKDIIQAEIDRRAGTPAGTPQTIVEAIDTGRAAREAAVDAHEQARAAGQAALEQRAQQYRDGSITPGGSDPLFQVREKLKVLGDDDQEGFDGLRLDYGTDAVEQAMAQLEAEQRASTPPKAISATEIAAFQQLIIKSAKHAEDEASRFRATAEQRTFDGLNRQRAAVTPDTDPTHVAKLDRDLKAAKKKLDERKNDDKATEWYQTYTVLQGMEHGIETGRWDAQLVAAVARLDNNELQAVIKRVIAETENGVTIGNVSSWFNEHFDEFVKKAPAAAGRVPEVGKLVKFQMPHAGPTGKMNAAGTVMAVNGDQVEVRLQAGGYHTIRLDEIIPKKGEQPYGAAPEATPAPAPEPVVTSFLDPADNATPIPTKMILVDAFDVITSDEDGFPANLQPRSRDIRASSDQQIEAMAKDVQPDKLVGVTEGAEGTPLVTPEGVVLAGNGRTAALRIADDAEYGKYRAKLDTEAAKYGFTPEDVAALERPMLVREVAAEVDVPTLERLAWQLNRGMPQADLTAAVASGVDASLLRAIKVADGSTIRDALGTIQNHAAIEKIINQLPVDWRSAYFEPGRGLTRQGIDLLEGVFLSKLLRADDRTLPGFEAARQLVFTMVEDASDEIRRLTQALGGSAAQLLASMDRTPEVAMLAEDLTPALRQIMSLRDRGMNYAAIVRELDTINAFDEFALSPVQNHLARVLAVSDSAGEVQTFLRGVAKAGDLNPEPGLEMFADQRLDYTGVLNEGIRAWNEGRRAATPVAKSELDPFPSTDAPYDTHLTGNRELPDGTPVGPVKLSVPLAPEDVDVDIAMRTTGAPHVDVVEGLADARPGVRDVQFADPDAARAHGEFLADPAGVRADVTELVETLESFDPSMRADFVAGLIDDVNAGTHSPAEWILLEHLTTVRRNEHGKLNMASEVLDDADLGARTMATLDKLESGERIAKAVDENPPGGTTAETELAALHRARVLRPRGQQPIDQAALADVVGPDVPYTPNPAGTLRQQYADAIKRLRDTNGMGPVIDPGTGQPLVAISLDHGLAALRKAMNDLPAEDLSAESVARAAAHTIVTGDNPTVTRQVREAVGAPRVEDGTRRNIEFNAPEDAAVAQMAEQRRFEAATAVEQAKRAVAEHDADPPTDLVEKPSVFPSPELGDQWDRLMRADIGVDDLAVAMGSSEPTGLATIADAIESIDRGVYKNAETGVGLEPTEAHALRSFLLAMMDTTLNDAMAAKGVRQGRASTRRIRRPDDFDTDALQDETKLVMEQLNERLEFVGDSPADGFLGVQYVPATPGRPSTAAPQAPITPRLLLRDRLMDDTVPGLSAELYVGRMEDTGRRIGNHRVARFLDSIYGARPEKELRARSIDNFKAQILRYVDPETMHPKQVAKIDDLIELTYAKWRDKMEESRFGPYPMYRRISLMGPEKLNAMFLEAVKETFGTQTPGFITAMAADGVDAGKLWRQADNRVRNYIRESNLPLSDGLEKMYGRVADLGEKPARWTTVTYHVARFLMDFRWLALEAIEPAMLTIPRGGLGPVLEAGALRKSGKVQALGRRAGVITEGEPLAFGVDAQKLALREFAHWAATTDMEQATGKRIRYLVRELAREQRKPFNKVIDDMLANDPEFARMAMELGDTKAQFLERLDRDWQLAESTTKVFKSEADAAAFFRPLMEAGVIDDVTFAEFVSARRSTSHPAIEAKLAATVGNPTMQAVYQRLAAINQSLFHDLTATFFGQENRSNLQRAVNHPFLFWPISYQIKATKWLLRIMLEETAGVDTGATTGLAFQRTWDNHKRRWATEPRYREKFAQNKNLMFLASMIFPIIPTELGVSLSPWTRMVLGQVTDQPYNRPFGAFGVGPIYTMLNLVPRIIAEQTKQGARFEDMPGADVARNLFPVSYSRTDPRDIDFEVPTSQIENETLPFLPGTVPVPEQLPTPGRYP